MRQELIKTKSGLGEQAADLHVGQEHLQVTRDGRLIPGRCPDSRPIERVFDRTLGCPHMQVGVQAPHFVRARRRHVHPPSDCAFVHWN